MYDTAYGVIFACLFRDRVKLVDHPVRVIDMIPRRRAFALERGSALISPSRSAAVRLYVVGLKNRMNASLGPGYNGPRQRVFLVILRTRARSDPSISDRRDSRRQWKRRRRHRHCALVQIRTADPRTALTGQYSPIWPSQDVANKFATSVYSFCQTSV